MKHKYIKPETITLTTDGVTLMSASTTGDGRYTTGPGSDPGFPGGAVFDGNDYDDDMR